MARFQFIRRGIAASPRAHAVVSQRSLRALSLHDAEERVQGPGWFASSWELAGGLDVHEGAPGDARLHEWLQVVRYAEPRSGTPQRHEQPRARLVPAAPDRALGDAMQLGDFNFAVAAEVAHLDQFSEFGIDGLELV